MRTNGFRQCGGHQRLSAWCGADRHPNDSYGWLQVKGPCAAIQAAGALSIGDYLWATTTDGAIDDTNTANANIHGIAVAR